MKGGRFRNRETLNRILDVFGGRGWLRYYEVRDRLKEIMPSQPLNERTLKRYLNEHVKMGNLEKMVDSGKTIYQLSSRGGMERLASIISASLKVQSQCYPDIQKGSIVLVITKKEDNDFVGLLILPEEDMKRKLAEKWKDKEWGKTITRPIITFINESLQPKPAFSLKIPGTDLFFFKPPTRLNELITSAVQSGDYETEADIIMHAINEWANMREKKVQPPISLDQFPFLKSALEKGIFKTRKEVATEALKRLEAQMRT